MFKHIILTQYTDGTSMIPKDNMSTHTRATCTLTQALLPKTAVQMHVSARAHTHTHAYTTKRQYLIARYSFFTGGGEKGLEGGFHSM